MNSKYREVCQRVRQRGETLQPRQLGVVLGDVATIAVTAVLAAVGVVFVLDMTGFLQKPPQ